MIAEITTEEFDATLERCALDALWEAAMDRPPVDAFRLARRLGITVARDERLTGRGRFVRLEGAQETILLGNESRRERRHWSVAHEVGESIAYRVYALLGIRPQEAPISTREVIANRLASSLLLPRRWFVVLMDELDGDLERLKQTFSTASYELIARRLLECTKEPRVVTLFDQGKVTWRRANTDLADATPHPIEQQCQRQAHLQNESTWDLPTGASDSGLARVRCWPVHEGGWRREIVISEPEGVW